MSGEVSTLPHEVIASDEHWLPFRTDVSHFGDLFRNFRAMGARESGRTIAELVLNMSGGVNVEPINEGELLPIPAKDSKQVLKIVEDRRILVPPIMRSRQAKLEEFDEVAGRMVTETLYGAPDEVKAIVPHDMISSARIARLVYYARGDTSGTRLIGIPSGRFFDIDNDDRYLPIGLLPLPRVMVGASYHHGRLDGFYRQVTSAAILEPIGSVRPSHRRRRDGGDPPDGDGPPLWGPDLEPQTS